MITVVPLRYREVAFTAVDVPLSQDALAGMLMGREAYRRTRFIVAHGPGYGTASAPGAQAACLAAGADGLLLDPVFTAKAFAELVSVIEAGLQGPAVFVHTGGTAAAVLELITERDAGKGAGDA